VDPNQGDRLLESTFRAINEDEADAGASPAVRARLLAEVRNVSRARQQRTYVALLGVAAAVFVAIAIPSWFLNGTSVEQQPDVIANTLADGAPDGQVPLDPANEFFPLTYGDVPVNDGRIVRLSVPRDALASFGLTDVESFESPRPGIVLADVVVGDDGLARAVRFVRADSLE
jgi:hypothetical protein